MSNDVIRQMIEREQRKQVAQKIRIWEHINGMTLTPMKRDSTRSRMEQIVDDVMNQRQGRQA